MSAMAVFRGSSFRGAEVRGTRVLHFGNEQADSVWPGGDIADDLEGHSSPTANIYSISHGFS